MSKDPEVMVLEDRCAILEHDLSFAKSQISKAYAERNRVAILAAALAQHLGMRAGIYRDRKESDRRFTTVLQIDLPTGQVTFHLDQEDREWVIFSPAWDIVNDYDGHDEETKWDRISQFKASFSVRSNDDVALASFRETVANLEAQIEMLRAQRTSLADRFERQRRGRQRLALVIKHLREKAETLRPDPNDPTKREMVSFLGASDLYTMFLAELENAENLADEKMRAMEETETR